MVSRKGAYGHHDDTVAKAWATPASQGRPRRCLHEGDRIIALHHAPAIDVPVDQLAAHQGLIDGRLHKTGHDSDPTAVGAPEFITFTGTPSLWSCRWRSGGQRSVSMAGRPVPTTLSVMSFMDLFAVLDCGAMRQSGTVQSGRRARDDGGEHRPVSGLPSVLGVWLPLCHMRPMVPHE